VGKTLTCNRCRPLRGGVHGGCGNITAVQVSSVLFCCHCLRLVIVIGIINIYFMFGFSAVIYLSFDTDTQQIGDSIL
jgi:hypothetical protein